MRKSPRIHKNAKSYGVKFDKLSVKLKLEEDDANPGMALSLQTTPPKKIKMEPFEGMDDNPFMKHELKLEATETDEKLTPNSRRKQRIIRKEPENWKEMFEGIKIFRMNHTAPVDTVGCERLANSLDPKSYRYEILCSLQLSSQTKDGVTAQAIKNLQTIPGGLTPETLLALTDEELDGHIAKVGFHKKKTIYLKKTALILRDDYGSDVPQTLLQLTNLPGIGPKMAHLTLQCTSF